MNLNIIPTGGTPPKYRRHPRAIDDPRELPELREVLIDFAREGGAWEATEVQRAMDEAARFSDDPRYLPVCYARGQNAVEWHRDTLPNAQLIFIDASMMDLLEEGIHCIPDELTIEELDAPAPAGLVVFGRPFYGLDSERGSEI